MDLPIDRYISQVRLNHPERVNEELYGQLTGEVFRIFVEHFGLATELKIIFTPSRRAERLRLCGESWLIYDQYLGQTFNILNRIFFNAESEREAITYFHKYVAERTIEYGCAELGVALANFYDDERECLRKTVEGDPRRTAFTVVCEQFAIFHELSHEIIDSGNDFAAFFMGIVSESIKTRRNAMLSQTRDSVIEGFKKANPAAYHGARLEDAIAEALDDFYSPESARGREAYIEALDSPDTAEELFCDFLACDFALEAHKDAALDLRDTLRALYVASYHLKTMDLVDRSLEATLFHKKSASDVRIQLVEESQAMQVRNHCLRNHLLMMYGARLLDQHEEDERSQLVNALSIDLMKDQRRYYETILDPATKTISFLSEPGRLQKMASEHEPVLERFTKDLAHPDKENARNALASIAILKQTGWPISAVARFASALGH